MDFGKQKSLAHIDPFKIKLNDDKIGDSSFRNARTTIKREEMSTNRESIRKLGLIHPITIRPISPDPDGYEYQLVCGSRRLRNILRLIESNETCYCPETAEWLPAKQVYATVKAFIRECDDETAIRINIAENLEHSKLHEIDLMEYCQELADLRDNGKPRYTRAEIASMCGRCESWISLTLDLLKLPDNIKQMMYDDRLTRTGALNFLQTNKDKLPEVIEESERIAREEKIGELKVAEGELKIAEIDLADAENDIEIQEMMGNNALREIAEKHASSCRKRVTAASNKRDTIFSESKKPKITGDIINRANLIVTGAKKGAPKAILPGRIKDLYTEFKNSKSYFDDETVFNTVNAVFEVILGHRAVQSIESLYKEIKEAHIVVEEET